MKKFEDGKIGFTDQETNRFELLSAEMEQIAMIEGHGREFVDEERVHLMNSSTSHSDPSVYLWTSGGCGVGVMDCQRMEYDFVIGLGGAGDGERLPVSLLSVDEGRKVMTVTSKKTSGTWFFNYWEKSLGGKDRVLTRPVEYVDNDRSIL